MCGPRRGTSALIAPSSPPSGLPACAAGRAPPRSLPVPGPSSSDP